MAATPILSITLKDAFGRTTRRNQEFAAHLLLAEYLVEASNYIALLETVTDLGIQRVDFHYNGLDGASDPEVDANVDVGATFVGYIDGGNGKKAVLKVPGWKTSLVNADGTIDVTDTTVAAFLVQWEVGGDFKLSDGERISSWISGKLDK